MRAGSAGLTYDGIEPKIFPGVVSRRRRSSLRGSSADLGDGEVGSGQGQVPGAASASYPTHSGFVRGMGEEDAVVEERDDSDD